MITEEQYNIIKYYDAKELKKWLDENNLRFSDVREAALNERRKKLIGGPFCSCCGESQKDGEYHTEECIFK